MTASEIVFAFLKMNNKIASRSEIGFQMVHVKKLLDKYSDAEIMYTLERLQEQGREVTSLGYLPYVIDTYVAQIRKQVAQAIIDTLPTPEPKQVEKTNNQNKVNNFGVKKDWGIWGE